MFQMPDPRLLRLACRFEAAGHEADPAAPHRRELARLARAERRARWVRLLGPWWPGWLPGRVPPLLAAPAAPAAAPASPVALRPAPPAPRAAPETPRAPRRAA
jgi:hypothetical protein